MRPSVPITSCLGLLILTACGGGGDVLPPSPAAGAIQSVAITPSGSVNVGVGDTLRLAAVVSTRSGAPAAQVRWRVSNGALATISPEGLLTAVAPGTFSVLAVASTPASEAFRADSMVSTVLVSSLPPALVSIDAQPGILSTPVGSIVHFEPTVVTATPEVQVTWAYQLQQGFLASVDGAGIITTYFPGSSVFRMTATGSAPGYQTTSLVVSRQLNIVPAPGISRFEVPPALTVPVGGTVAVPITLEQPRGALAAAISAESNATPVATAAGEFRDWTVTGRAVGTATVTFRAYFPGAGGYYAITRLGAVVVTVVP